MVISSLRCTTASSPSSRTYRARLWTNESRLSRTRITLSIVGEQHSTQVSLEGAGLVCPTFECDVPVRAHKEESPIAWPVTLRKGGRLWQDLGLHHRPETLLHSLDRGHTIAVGHDE